MISAISSSLCIEIPIYWLYCFVGYFARPQIYALPSKPYTLCSDSLFHKEIHESNNHFTLFVIPALQNRK